MNAPFFFVGLFIFLIHILFDQQAISVIGIIMILYGYTEWSLYSWLYSFIWILAFVDVLIFGLKIFKFKIPSRAKCAANRKRRREKREKEREHNNANNQNE